jgi:hypothetical protein
MRDSYLSKLHPSIPKSTRDVLRRSPLISRHLFLEETVANTAANLTGDFQLQTNSRALQRLQALVQSTRGRGKRPQYHQFVRNPQQPKKVRFEQPRLKPISGSRKGLESLTEGPAP